MQQNWETLTNFYDGIYYVKELNQDLLGGRALTHSNYRVILAKDQDIAGIYPVGDDGTIDPANSFSYLSVCIRKACFIFELQPLTRQNMRNCQVTPYGIED